ncbi:hypothetical protein [Kitasatospora sp. NPDC093558]|uniref:hypothetical protein n=1 Tax=Kitasatospora sp. NPDC093558 TaxID=3155201 RepID=UPI00342EB6DD
MGAALGTVGFLLTLVPWDDVFRCGGPGWSCLGLGLLVLAVLAVVGFLVSWLALRLVGVRLAWRVAVALVPLGWLETELRDRAGAWGLPDALLPLTTAALFAVAAVVTANRPLLWRPRIALLVALVLLWPLSALAGGHRADDRLRSELVGAGVPLYAPDVTGYRLRTPMASKPGAWFGFLMLPDRPGVDPDDPNRWGIRVTVEHVSPAFKPPHCEALDLGSTVNGDGCEQVAPDTWRRANPYVVFYFVRRGDDLIVLSADGKNNTEAELRTLISTLAVRDADYFLG